MPLDPVRNADAQAPTLTAESGTLGVGPSQLKLSAQVAVLSLAVPSPLCKPCSSHSKSQVLLRLSAHPSPIPLHLPPQAGCSCLFRDLRPWSLIAVITLTTSWKIVGEAGSRNCVQGGKASKQGEMGGSWQMVVWSPSLPDASHGLRGLCEGAGLLVSHSHGGCCYHRDKEWQWRELYLAGSPGNNRSYTRGHTVAVTEELEVPGHTESQMSAQPPEGLLEC